MIRMKNKDWKWKKQAEYMFYAARINFSDPEMLDSEVSFLGEEFSFKDGRLC